MRMLMLVLLSVVAACAAVQPQPVAPPPTLVIVRHARVTAAPAALEARVVAALQRALAHGAVEAEVTVDGRRWACIRAPLDRLRAGDIELATVWHVYVRDVTPTAAVRSLTFDDAVRP